MSSKLFAFFGILLLSSCAASVSERRGLFDLGTSELPKNAWDASAEGSCLSRSDREKLLEIADPTNYPHTRYRQGPRRSLDKETDCSHFVHEIYRRAGFGFSFADSSNLKHSPDFDLIPESQALPGDLMLFRGHVGIVDKDGRIISATKTRRNNPRSSITRMNRDNFRPIRSARSVLRFRCRSAPTRHLASDPR